MKRCPAQSRSCLLALCSILAICTLTLGITKAKTPAARSINLIPNANFHRGTLHGWTVAPTANVRLLAATGPHNGFICRYQLAAKNNAFWALHSPAVNLPHRAAAFGSPRVRIAWRWAMVDIHGRPNSPGALMQVAFFNGPADSRGDPTGKFLGQFVASSGLGTLGASAGGEKIQPRRHQVGYEVPPHARSLVVAFGANPSQRVTGTLYIRSVSVSLLPSRRGKTVLPIIKRPYPTLEPKMPPPAQHLLVARVGKLAPAEQRLLVTLQGLVNRTKPRIYLIWKQSDWFWLRQLKKQHAISGWVVIKNPLSLVQRFGKLVHGAVIPDPAIYDSPDIACDIASLNDLVVATPQLAKKLHLPVKVDLRGRFKNDAAALRFLRVHLLPRMNPYLFLCLNPNLLGRGAADQIIAARGLIFWVTGRAEQKMPGADMYGEKRQIRKLLASTPLGGIVRGFWWDGTGSGLGEGPGVALASRYGKLTVVSDYLRNFSVFSGVQVPRLKQTFLPAPKLQRSKVYISLTISDGDNIDTWQTYFRHWFQSPYHGRFAVGWGMGPTLIDLAPTIARWYYQHASPKDQFFADVSGVGYFYPAVWADRLQNKVQAQKYVYSLTWQYMRRMDMRTFRSFLEYARSQRQARRVIAAMGAALPQVKYLLPDYGYSGEKGYKNITYQLPSGQIVFRAATNSSFGGKWSVRDMVREIHAHVGHHRPAFLNIFIFNWGSGMHRLYRLLKALGPTYVDVTPSQLATLYRRAAQPGPYGH